MKRVTGKGILVGLVLFISAGGTLGSGVSDADVISKMPDGDLSAVDLPDVAAPGMFDGANEAEMFDLTSLAKERGMTREEAIGRYGWGRNFSLLVGEISRSFPDDYAGAAIERDGSAWIAFRAETPEPVNDLVQSFNERVLQSELYGRASTNAVLVVPGRGFSETELNDRTMATHYAVYGKVDGAKEVSTSYEQVSGKIEMTVIADSSDLAKVGAEVRTIIGSDVELILVDGPIGSDDATHMGGQPTTTCTAGWVVTNPTLGRGVATAAHCQDQQSMNGVALDYIIAHEGTHGDMQWHRKVGQTFPDDFKAGAQNTWNSDQRDVAAVGTPVVGLFLYKNGKKGFRDSDDIKALGHCVNGSCNLVRVFLDNAIPGDSGGPWYAGNTAYGLHKGDNLHDWAIRDVFTRADALWAVSAAVATS